MPYSTCIYMRCQVVEESALQGPYWLQAPSRGRIGSGSGFPQQRATCALGSFSIVQVAHFDLSCRCDLQAGAAPAIHAIPDSLVDLGADEFLFELACCPCPHGKAFLLYLELDLQSRFYEPGSLGFPGFSALPAKGAGPQGYLNLNAVERANPFASQLCLGMRGDACGDRQQHAQCRRIIALHNDLLDSPVDRSFGVFSRSVLRPDP